MFPTREKIDLASEFGRSFLDVNSKTSGDFLYVGREHFGIHQEDERCEGYKDPNDKVLSEPGKERYICDNERPARIDGAPMEDGDPIDYFPVPEHFAVNADHFAFDEGIDHVPSEKQKAKIEESLKEMARQYAVYYQKEQVEVKSITVEPAVVISSQSNFDDDPLVQKRSKILFDLSHKKRNSIFVSVTRSCWRGKAKPRGKKPARSEAIRIKEVAAERYFDDLFGGDNVVSMDDFVFSHTERRARNNRSPRALTRHELLEIAFF